MISVCENLIRLLFLVSIASKEKETKPITDQLMLMKQQRPSIHRHDFSVNKIDAQFSSQSCFLHIAGLLTIQA
jgi:hypothetical protein